VERLCFDRLFHEGCQSLILYKSLTPPLGTNFSSNNLRKMVFCHFEIITALKSIKREKDLVIK